ncbi:MAG: Na(+) H(+) antiporter subunit D [Nitrospira sp.]|jgi:multicomponent K+:H+ antiporter subunit D|nr:MAG: Na(+) H(+) antiporter subunit D [Nitrospira sp.]
MTHLLAAPIIVPALAAALLVILHRAPIEVKRAIGMGATVAVASAALAIFSETRSGTPLVYRLGDWPSPFGIVLVADHLSAFMLLLTASLALAVLLYAVQGWDTRGKLFHPLFLFQMMGLNGAFLTGDLFNLFVFFEILLIASYGLAMEGLEVEQLRATLHYAAINIAASSVFLIAVSLMYGVMGTLNMAHLAERVAEVRAEDVGLVRAAGLLLLGVFAVKAAVFPLYFWLPAAYSHAPAPVAALFAVMTKVGVYAIIRVTTLIFTGGEDGVMELTSPWLLPVALITLTFGTLGALGAQRLATMTAYLTIASIGTILTGVASGGEGLAAALYYLAHSTLIIAVLFLVADLLSRSRGAVGDQLHPGPPLRQAVPLGLAFLFGGATVAGIPPSSGFLGKLMILQSTMDGMMVIVVWVVILVTSVLTLVTCSRAGSIVLWNYIEPDQLAHDRPPRAGEWIALAALTGCSMGLVIFAAPVTHYTGEIGAQLTSPGSYIHAVLGSGQDDFIRPHAMDRVR